MTPNVAPRSPARPLTGHQPLLVALGTLLAWNLVALAGWSVYIVVITRRDPDWGDLVAIVSAMLGVGAFCLSLLIGSLVVAFINRRGRWSQAALPLDRAVGYGTAAAAVGLAPFVIYVAGALIFA
jgi:hypothetical protein